MAMKLLSVSIRLAACLILILLNGCSRTVTGTYVVFESDGLVRLDLVRTPDSRLSGEITLVRINPHGKLDQNSYRVSGASDGDRLTLAGSGFLGMESASVSGQLSGRTLTITGRGLESMELQRTGLVDIQKAVTTLKKKADEIARAEQVQLQRERQATDRANFVAAVDAHATRLQEFQDAVSTRTKDLGPAESRIRAITTSMERYLERQRELARNPNARVMRSQIVIAMNQGTIASDQWQSSLETLQSDFIEKRNALIPAAQRLLTSCTVFISHLQDESEQEFAARQSSCQRLSAIDAPAVETAKKLETGLVHLQKVYLDERARQDAALRSAEQLQ